VEGKIARDLPAKVLRENEEIYRSKVQSLRRFKETVSEVEAGFECGIIMVGFDDYREGDVIEIFRMETQNP
jgi:translation initiation factor IF-2